MPTWVTELLLPFGILLLVPWLVYWDLLSSGWVSDDCASQDAAVSKPIATYDGLPQKPASWHNTFKRLRFFVGRFPNPNRNWKRDKQPPVFPSATLHHRLNLWLASGVFGLLYLWLRQVLDPHLAFLAILLWECHPLGMQTIGWVSGIGYLTGTFFMLLGLNLLPLFHQHPWFQTSMGNLTALLAFGLCQWMAVEAWFVTVGVVAILLWLGEYSFAVFAALFAGYQCAHTLKEALDLRKKTFQDQQMGQSTLFYPKKFVVVLKTWAYNLRLMLWPKRLGLYHMFGYHYELPYMEWEDGWFLAGLGLFLGAIWLVWRAPAPISFGTLWIGSYLILFLNWITANQFVVDRYAWLPSFGVCLLLATLLPLPAYMFLLGVALMRTWAHQPTYVNEETFYQSNIWNFPQSEVAYGNLGVTYVQEGWVGSALETWWRGVKLNPEYDVNWYNIASAFKSRGPVNPQYFPRFFSELPPELLQVAYSKDPERSHLHLARYCLQKAQQARTCHFPQAWMKELQELNQVLSRPAGLRQLPVRLHVPLLTVAVT